MGVDSIGFVWLALHRAFSARLKHKAQRLIASDRMRGHTIWSSP